MRMVSLIAGLKMEEIVKWRGIISQGPLYLVYMIYMPLHVFRILMYKEGVQNI